MRDFIAFDTETTGTSPDRDELVEIGAVLFRSGQPAESFCTFVRPRKPIPPGATRVNGITDEMVKGAPSLEEALIEFAKFCGETTLVAHNAPFDVKFITAAVKRLEVIAPRGQVLDTYPMAKALLPSLFNHRLESLVRHLKIEAATFHRAAADAASCGQVFVALLKQMLAAGEKPAMRRLIELSNGALSFPVFAHRPMQLGLLG